MSAPAASAQKSHLHQLQQLGHLRDLSGLLQGVAWRRGVGNGGLGGFDGGSGRALSADAGCKQTREVRGQVAAFHSAPFETNMAMQRPSCGQSGQGSDQGSRPIQVRLPAMQRNTARNAAVFMMVVAMARERVLQQRLVPAVRMTAVAVAAPVILWFPEDQSRSPDPGIPR